MSSNETFNAEVFVRDLYTEGSTVTCDVTNPIFEREERPPFYDREKYERGYKFFKKYLVSILLSKLLALIIGLADPTFNRILQKTNKSSNPDTALKRYKATIEHIHGWYRDDFSPGSKAWRSLRIVKSLHNNASKMVNKQGMARITQKDMALVQMGFVIILLLEPKRIGIYNAREEEIEGFIHIWRNIGYLLSIEDRFNMCRDSVNETRDICRVLMDRLYPIYLEEMEGNDYKKMVTAFITGARKALPFMNVDYISAFSKDVFFACKFHTAPLELLEVDDEVKKKLHRMVYVINLMRFSIIRIIYNKFLVISTKLMRLLARWRWT